MKKLKNGDHFWAIYNEELRVFIKLDNTFFIAGGWEGNFNEGQIEFVSIIIKPIKNNHD